MDAIVNSNTDQQSENQKEWALRLFAKSPLKRQKFRYLKQFIGDTTDKTCLDIGSDNGVISLMLRERGGEWSSADLIPETVESIRSLVGDRVFQIDGQSTPFQDNEFDRIVIVDFLEHIETDNAFVTELTRILKPGGKLIVNVPNPKNGLIRWLKHLVGQTDEAHGHVRPGYSLQNLEELMGSNYKTLRSANYFRFFSDLIDLTTTFALDILKGKRGKKGTVVTGSDLNKLKKSFRIYSLLSPFFSLAVFLDSLIPWMHGNMLIVEFQKD